MFPEIKVITEDATSIISQNQTYNAFYAGHFERGPVNELTQITSIYDFKITFGKPLKSNFNEWFQIYNYFLYNNKCIYIVRTDSEQSAKASSPLGISAKYPGEYGNNILVTRANGGAIQVYLNNELVDSIDWGNESFYIDYPKNLPDTFSTRLNGGFHGEPSSQDIANAYEYGNTESVDFDFILANENYEYPAIKLAENKLAIAFVHNPVYNASAICYQGAKRQKSIFDGKSYNIPILGDALGLRAQLSNDIGLTESHCKRSYSLTSIEGAKILNLKELYAKHINSIAKNDNSYYFYSETLCNGNQFTSEFILNRLKKETSSGALYFVFEQNDAMVWNDFEKKLSAICQSYKDSGYIADYQVVCNDSNQSTIEPNAVYADIYVKMNGVIEQVVISVKSVSSL